jgi:hypothetical protein
VHARSCQAQRFESFSIVDTISLGLADSRRSWNTSNQLRDEIAVRDHEVARLGMATADAESSLESHRAASERQSAQLRALLPQLDAVIGKAGVREAEDLQLAEILRSAQSELFQVSQIREGLGPVGFAPIDREQLIRGHLAKAADQLVRAARLAKFDPSKYEAMEAIRQSIDNLNGALPNTSQKQEK